MLASVCPDSVGRKRCSRQLVATVKPGILLHDAPISGQLGRFSNSSWLFGLFLSPAFLICPSHHYRTESGRFLGFFCGWESSILAYLDKNLLYVDDFVAPWLRTAIHLVSRSVGQLRHTSIIHTISNPSIVCYPVVYPSLSPRGRSPADPGSTVGSTTIDSSLASLCRQLGIGCLPEANRGRVGGEKNTM